MIYDVVAIGIECGISPLEIWDYTLDEIKDFINGYRKREKDNLKTQSAIVYRLGTLISLSFNEPDKFPTIDKAFPGLFDLNKEEVENATLLKQKALMEAYAISHNNKFKKETGVDR